MFDRIYFVRNAEGDSLLENFLVSAVVSILIIRFSLHITGYPQLGGDGLHIAHMLWGGLFMLVAIFLLLSFFGRPIYGLAAIIGGIGFGTFIDELGKFITSSNNYFYTPTVALIYAILIIIYLSSQYIDKRRKLSKNEYLINTLEILKEAVQQDLDADEKKKARQYLRRCDQKNPIVISLTKLISEVDAIPVNTRNTLARFKNFVSKSYTRLVQGKWFIRLIIVVFLVQSVVAIANAIELADILLGAPISQAFAFGSPKLGFMQYGELISSVLSGFFVWWGITHIRSNRLLSYQLFKKAILVSIFLTQFFAFYDQQFDALVGLVFNILLLIALDYMIEQEKDIKDLEDQKK